jgi:hypothetical protein
MPGRVKNASRAHFSTRRGGTMANAVNGNLTFSSTSLLWRWVSGHVPHVMFLTSGLLVNRAELSRLTRQTRLLEPAKRNSLSDASL